MNAIIGMTSLLLNTELTSQQRDFVATIHSSGDALLILINDILDLSKIESGKLELEQRAFNLQTCIEQALDVVALKAAEKSIELAYIIHPETPNTIVGDVTRLRQILMNLLSNAVKFTNIGEVVVSVTAQEIGMRRNSDENLSPSASYLLPVSENSDKNLLPSYEIQFAVKDTGIGIPQERRERLFKAFSQGDASTTREYGGTGLGLAIGKQLSEIMGGRMWVESDVNQGSTFYFTIVAPSVADPTIVEDVPPQLTGKRVLIVDDNVTNRQILSLQLQSWGILTRAASGFEALELIKEGELIDLAILDMQMPKMDGLTLAAEIRRLPECQELPLIMLTSIGSLDNHPQLNFAAFLTKPVKRSHLYDVLSHLNWGKLTHVQPANSALRQTNSLEPAPLSLRILLAEDNIVNQKVAIQILQSIGYQADVVNNGLEVLAALRRQSYDVVLMDVQMPKMDGLAATRRICQEWGDTRPRIIAMTANAMQGDRTACCNAGMDDYLTKPIRVEELAQALRNQDTFVRIQDDAGEFQLTTNSPINAKVLQSFRNMVEEEEVVTEMIDCYIEDAQSILDELEQAANKQARSQLRLYAHTLKSSSATLGAITLSQLFAQLEAISFTGDVKDILAVVSQIQSEFKHVKTALQVQRQPL